MSASGGTREEPGVRGQSHGGAQAQPKRSAGAAKAEAFGRWHCMLVSASALADGEGKRQAVEDCLSCLDTALEVFPRTLEVDDEAGFAVRTFAHALRARLAALPPDARRPR